jgi:hypothetical protein
MKRSSLKRSLQKSAGRTARRWRLGPRLVWCVALLQAGMLLTLFVTRPAWYWTRSHLLGLLWAWAHQPAFYPLMALLLGGPLLSVMAWRIRGSHRAWLLVAWAVFIPLVLVYYPDQIRMMLDSLQWSMTH